MALLEATAGSTKTVPTLWWNYFTLLSVAGAVNTLMLVFIQNPLLLLRKIRDGGNFYAPDGNSCIRWGEKLMNTDGEETRANEE